MADTFPFDKAVNNADEKMFNPLNKKLKAKIKNPSRAISYTGVPCGEKTLIKAGPPTWRLQKPKRTQ